MEKGCLMSRMENIVRQIGELSPAELAAFREWFAKFDASAWDRQFEADVKAGKFDSLAEQALVPRPSDWFPNAPGRACPAPTPRRCRGEARLALAPSVRPAEMRPATSVASLQEGGEVLAGSCGSASPRDRS